MEYNIPIYLDIDLLLDLLASLEDGFSTFKKINTTENNEQNISNQGNVGFSFGQFFSFGLRRTKNDSESTNNVSEIEKYYTYGSMMNKLLNKLDDEKLVKTLSDEDSWNQLELYDFVEIQGKFKPNPLSDSFNKIQNMVDLILKIPILNTDTTTKNKNTNRNNKSNNKNKNYKPKEIKNMENINEMFKSINESLEKENSQKYIIEINSKYSCILNLFNEYIRDNSGLELPYGNFKVLGKVIKKIGKDEEYNLLEETPFALSDELIKALIESLETVNEQINLPEITIITNNCIQIIPIAIYV